MPEYIDARSSKFAILKGGKHYVVSDEDEASDPRYYGFLAHDGTWIIMQQTLSTGAYRFVAGHGNFATAYTNRASQSYDYYDQLP